MARKIKVEITDGRGSWCEEYEIADNENATEYATAMLDKFNSSLRANESARTLLGVEECGTGTQKHVWVKTNAFTIYGRNGAYDNYQCKNCGITGKSMGLSGIVKRDSRYKAKCYENCDTALKQIEKNRKKNGGME